MQPSISAIIPVYNGRRYLRQAVESVLIQDLPPTELLIVDDGSTDGSLDVIADLDPPFPIRTWRRDNAGQSAARNDAAHHAAGELLAFLDQDDAWHGDHLRRLSEPFASRPDIGFTYGDVDEIDEDGGLVTLNYLEAQQLGHPKRTLIDLLSRDMFILPSALMVRAEAYHQVGGFDPRLSGYEDDDLCLRLFRAGYRYVFEPASVTKWRVRHDSASGTPRMLESGDLYAELLMERFPDQPELGRWYVRDCIAPRFFLSAFAQYHRWLLVDDMEAVHERLQRMHRFAPLLPSSWKYALVRRALLPLMRFPNAYRRLRPVVRPVVGPRYWP